MPSFISFAASLLLLSIITKRQMTSLREFRGQDLNGKCMIERIETKLMNEVLVSLS